MQARSVRVVAERNHDEPFSRAARTALRRSLDPATPWIVPRLACAGIEDSPDPCSIIALRFRRNVKSAMSGQNLLTQKNNAARYERAGERKAYRAGHYDRSLTAKDGRLGLKVPKLKGEVFESAVIERHRRREESVDPPLSRQVPAR